MGRRVELQGRLTLMGSPESTERTRMQTLSYRCSAPAPCPVRHDSGILGVTPGEPSTSQEERLASRSLPSHEGRCALTCLRCLSVPRRATRVKPRAASAARALRAAPFPCRLQATGEWRISVGEVGMVVDGRAHGGDVGVCQAVDFHAAGSGIMATPR